MKIKREENKRQIFSLISSKFLCQQKCNLTLYVTHLNKSLLRRVLVEQIRTAHIHRIYNVFIRNFVKSLRR